MYRNSTKIAVSSVIAAFVILLGWTSTASADPSPTGSRLQLAEDNKANCQLLADSTANAEQKARALACVADQNAIIALLVGPTTSPSPTTTTTSPTPTPSPSVTTPSPTPTTTTASPSPTPTATTPSPTPTTSGPRLTNCFTQLAACGYPTISSTGVPAGSFLTPRTGGLIANVAGATYTNLRISGCVQVRAANITIRNSIITGPCFYGVDMQSGSLTIVDSEINCVNGKGTGIAWANFHALRLYIHDCENALEMGANSSVEDSYLVAREATSDGHGDDIQSQGGNNVVIRHNTFAGVSPITSSIITNPDKNHGWLVELNFLSSGAYTLYCPENGTNFTVRNNRFYPAKTQEEKDRGTGSSHSASYGLADACNHSGIIWSGNYRDNNLSEVKRTD